MDRAQRGELLRHVRAGLDVVEASQLAGASMGEIRKGGAKLQREIDAAYDLATSRLRSKLLKGVLSGDGDLRLLAGVLEHREAAQAASAAEVGINRIQVSVVDAECANCGHRYANANSRRPQRSTADRGNGLEDAAQPEPAAPVKQPFVRRYGPSVRMGGI